MHTRENIQLVNKKNKDLRVINKMNPTVGLYDMQNERKLQELRSMSAQGNYNDNAVKKI